MSPSGHGTALLFLLLSVLLIPKVEAVCTRATFMAIAGNTVEPADDNFMVPNGQNILGYCTDEDQAPDHQTLTCDDTVAVNLQLGVVRQCVPRCPELGSIANGGYLDYARSATDPTSGTDVIITCNPGWSTSVTIRCVAGAWVDQGAGGLTAPYCTADIDECNPVAPAVQPCGANSLCQNTDGGYDCECEVGFEPPPPMILVGGVMVPTDVNSDCVRGRCRDLPPVPLDGRYDGVTQDFNQVVRIDCAPGWRDTNAGVATFVEIQCQGPNPLVGVEGWALSLSPATVATANILCATDFNECNPAVNPNPPCGVLTTSHSQCQNTIGSYDCECEVGYQAPLNGALGDNCIQISCQDTPPVPLNGEYDGVSTIVNGGVVTVTCAPGWRDSNGGLPGTATVDIECIGTGWVLQADNAIPATAAILCAEDYNECTMPVVAPNPNPVCGLNAQCQNTMGSYECDCDVGYQAPANGAINAVCTQIACPTLPPHVFHGSYSGAENALNNAVLVTCEPGWSDANANGGLTGVNIDCDSGVWEVVGTTTAATSATICADDIDECATTVCGANAQCKNCMGSYSCECNAGFQPPANSFKNADCVPAIPQLAECGHPPQYANAFHPEIDFSQTLVSAPAITGTCLPGWQVAGPPASSTFDIDCLADAAGGFNWTPAASPCTNINECVTTPPSRPCGNNAKCIDNIGSYTCVCFFGYMRNPSSHFTSGCTPVTCGEPGVDSYATYAAIGIVGVNTVVTYTCVEGFGFGYTSTGTPKTTYTKTCLNTGKWSSGDNCKDIDECDRNHGICGDYSKHRCLNTKGSYKCWCAFGYTMNAAGTCGPVPPDEMDKYRCHDSCIRPDRPYEDDDKDKDKDKDDETFIIAVVGLSLSCFFSIIVICLICLICCCQVGARPVPQAPNPTVVCATPNPCSPYGQNNRWGGMQWLRSKGYGW